MAQLLVMPVFQPLDSNGAIQPAGTVYTYVPGTTTPKTSWKDPAQTMPNSNPITLDSTGSCLLYGDGAYRIQVYNAAAVLTMDEVTASWISTVMEPITDATSVTSASGLLGVTSHGQCRLVYTNNTTLTLNPYNGNALIINGVIQSIPAGGVTLAVAALSASTFYYIYAFMSGSTMTLEASATAYAVASNGVYTKNGDTTRTLVGAAYTDTVPHFNDSATSRGVLSWFNRQPKQIQGANTNGASAISGGFVNLGSGSYSADISNWTDGPPMIGLMGVANNNTGGDGFEAAIGDGSATSILPQTISSISGSSGANYDISTGPWLYAGSEGRHLYEPLGAALVGGTAIFNFNIVGMIMG